MTFGPLCLIKISSLFTVVMLCSCFKLFSVAFIKSIPYFRDCATRNSCDFFPSAYKP
ncbi:hypothetical protein BY458DRAFT_511824, partial [Sporodiniella umbellata]